jgi:hypothetical protein
MHYERPLLIVLETQTPSGKGYTLGRGFKGVSLKTIKACRELGILCVIPIKLMEKRP